MIHIFRTLPETTGSNSKLEAVKWIISDRESTLPEIYKSIKIYNSINIQTSNTALSSMWMSITLNDVASLIC